MKFKFSESIGPVRLAVMDTAEKSEKRRLRVANSEKIPCKSKCSGCCRRMIGVSMAECVIIYDHLKNSGKWASVRKRAKKLMPLVKEADPISWFTMGIPCPILDPTENTCLAYKVRPVACSTHFVQSDPGLCDPHTVKSGTYKPLDFVDLVNNFTKRLSSSVAGQGILQIHLPIPSGLLLAEAINVQSGLSLEKAAALFLNEL